MSTVDDFSAAQAVEYGTYKAVYPILHDGVLAYNPGDAVPVSNVEAHGYLEAGLVTADGVTPPQPAAPTPPAGDPLVVDAAPDAAPVPDSTPAQEG